MKDRRANRIVNEFQCMRMTSFKKYVLKLTVYTATAVEVERKHKVL